MKGCSTSLAMRKIYIKTMNYPTRMAIVKKTDNIKCWQGYEETGTLIAGGNLNDSATLENSLAAT